jgi:hypothetical protein
MSQTTFFNQGLFEIALPFLTNAFVGSVFAISTSSVTKPLFIYFWLSAKCYQKRF